MGIDLFIGYERCKECGHEKEGWQGSYTYNCAPMRHEIYPEDKRMVYIDGLIGKKN